MHISLPCLLNVYHDSSKSSSAYGSNVFVFGHKKMLWNAYAMNAMIYIQDKGNYHVIFPFKENDKLFLGK